MIEVTAGIIEKENKVLIARRKPGIHLSGLWEFPGGKIERGETKEAALGRELNEEFGVRTKTKIYFNTNKHDYGDFKIKLISYSSEFLDGEFRLTDHDKIEWVKIDELGNYDIAETDLPIIEKLKASFPNIK